MDLREVLRTSSLRSFVHVVSLAAGFLSSRALPKALLYIVLVVLVVFSYQ